MMSHANLVMACQWGWSSTPDSEHAQPTTSTAPQSTSTTPFNNIRSKRFAPCQGRLYHQLLCSHRIRTDLVEDCGGNCVEPFGNSTGLAFVCNECIQEEAIDIWEQRKAQHGASYPPIDQMSKEQYDLFFEERRLLEAEFAREHKLYEMELKANMRPSNICSAQEASTEETEFAAELDSLSLAMMSSGDGAVQHQLAQTRGRSSLPSDASEQLHWTLNSLALDRGACGIEYSTSQSPNGVPSLRQMNEEELWKKPRE
ncbi:hypothetical protein BU25DRAFT_415228 [Macroventuria anomochaeta]|uniref:Uncharacterized protein n=1 Tax=Macroventuria anomochaeta TaxID=301207 RepID=A0ACB6RL67_9PLEO|nr:uncharacterized protein BU25DRAFT_415228 [Macroventuria anomochaeta]KAF2622504.1 hypothetical protein BU25DRAFT_415228 [Macroventuria anomochaeta]